MFAALTSFKTNRKCLLLTLCNPDKGRNIEDYAYAKYMDDIDTDSPDSMFHFDDSGIDALVRRAETSGLTEENFSNCVSPTMQTAKAFDLIESSKSDGFEDDIVERFHIVREILDTAGAMYDYVFIVSDSTNPKLTKCVKDVSDRIVTIVRQTNAVSPIHLDEDEVDKNFFLVGDFEPESAYNIRFLKKSYGVKHLYVMPHNIKYRDASIQGQLVRYAMRNIDTGKSDVNNYLVTCLLQLISDLFGNPSSIQDHETSFTTIPKGEPLNAPHLQERERAIAGTGTSKGGLFSKAKPYSTGTFPDGDVPVGDDDGEMPRQRRRRPEPEKRMPRKPISVPAYDDVDGSSSDDLDDEDYGYDDDLDDIDIHDEHTTDHFFTEPAEKENKQDKKKKEKEKKSGGLFGRKKKQVPEDEEDDTLEDSIHRGYFADDEELTEEDEPAPTHDAQDEYYDDDDVDSDSTGFEIEDLDDEDLMETAEDDQEPEAPVDDSAETIQLAFNDIHSIYSELFEDAIAAYGKETGVETMHSDDYLSYMQGNNQDLYQADIPIKNYDLKSDTVQAAEDFICDWDLKNPNFALVSAQLFYDRDGSRIHCEYVPFGHYTSGITVRNSIKRALKEMGFADEEDWLQSQS